jgi:4-hydroxy-tetrahydrodipicolinate reductase
MRYALVGYGKMGRAIEAQAAARGHALAAIVDRAAAAGGAVRVSGSIGAASWRGVKVAFEFTEPAAARGHVVDLLKRGVAVVCGTTGWDAADADVRRAARSGGVGAVIAPNFSIGMNLFYAAVAEAARRYMAVGGYDPWVVEWHHRAKADAPSGTARRLAAVVASAGRAPASVREGLHPGALAPGDVHVAAVRAGSEPGRHIVGFDGRNDVVTLEHAARGREGFAHGAVLAAEWLNGRRGVHGFDDVLDDLVSGRSARGGRR